MLRVLLTAGLLLAPMGATLAARSPGDIAEVRTGLFAFTVGEMIQENCDSITPRLIRVFTLRNTLLATARAAGFSAQEIDDYVDDKIARANLRAEASEYLADAGATPGNEASFCAVGASEIARETAVGRLLRAQ